MKTPADVIAHGLQGSGAMMQRFVADLTPQEYLHRPVPKANCVAWLLGHLTLTDRRSLLAAGCQTLPELPAGFEQRFSREEGAPQAGDFGAVDQLLPIFQRHRAMLVEQVRSLDASIIEKPTEKPHPMFKTIGEMLNFMSIHTMLHVGQITIIRRSLGKPPLI